MASAVVAKKTILVLGATGATGRHVVAQLLNKGQNVRAIVRSKERFETSLHQTGFSKKLLDDEQHNKKQSLLSVTEGAILDIPSTELKELVKDCDAVISCLGHNGTVSGVWGQPHFLVRDSVMNLTSVMSKNQKFILMGTELVIDPLGRDDPPSCGKRVLLSLLRNLIPPHYDNEEAAKYLAYNVGTPYDNDDEKSPTPLLEWCIVRPTNLIDGPVTFTYNLFDKPSGTLGSTSQVATRANVAACMVDLALCDDTWIKYKYQMPVLHDAKEDSSAN